MSRNEFKSCCNKESKPNILKDPRYNKGLAFTIEERIHHGIHGLLPPIVHTQAKQVELQLKAFRNLVTDLDKYSFLVDLLNFNERLFFRLVCENVTEMLPFIYTPTVGYACQNLGELFRRPRGMYISIKDKGRIAEMLKNWPVSDVKCIVVTDGERILGLGDLGAFGMGIPIGKLGLNSALAKIVPYQCLPITLDVGTNTKQILDDPFYFGLEQKRARGTEYDEFIEEFMKACVDQFGRTCLIQFEDFGNLNAFRLLEKYMDNYTTFNDDIQGTAAVAVAGIYTAMRISETKKLSDNTILFFGAGEAALGIASLCVFAMQEEGLNENQAREKLFLVDSKGLVVKDRETGGITVEKEPYCKKMEPMEKLIDIVQTVKPTVLIGCSTIKGSFTPEVLRAMACHNVSPIIFALSNPTSKSECTAEEAYSNTEGRCVLATGSPFPPVTYKNKTYHTGQGNNAFIFPGLSLGIIAAGMKKVPQKAFKICSEVISRLVTDEDLQLGRIYPSWSQIHDISLELATAVAEYAYENDLASVMPRPSDIKAFIQSQQFDYNY